MRKLPKKLLILLLVPISIFIVNFAKANPLWIEEYYSEGFYAVIASFLGSITAFFPFSLAEIIIILIPFTVILYLVIAVIKIIKNKLPIGQAFTTVLNCFLNIILCGCILYFMFTAMWSINYYRPSLAYLLEFETGGISEDELYNTSLFLAHKANEARDLLDEDENGVFTSKKNLLAVTSGSSDGFKQLKSQYEFIKFVPHKAKPVFLSTGMSYLGITGIYIPHTFEANVNRKIEAFMLPSTLSHEQAHQLGFAREDEANFISFLACINHEDPEFQYSGYMLAFIHTSNALFTQNPEKYNQVIYSLSDGAFRDLKANWAFWRKYESKASEIQDTVNDKYLKAQGQESGIKSYGLMVDLVIAYLNSNNKIPEKVDYADVENWLSIPEELSQKADVLYFYPTTYTPLTSEDKDICTIDNESMRQGAQNMLLGQASAFETCADIYAPYYRQVNAMILAGMSQDEMIAIEMGEPYQDVTAALDYYFENCNNGRPYFLAGHSQGGMMIYLVLSDYMKQHPEYYENMVAAYMLGNAPTKDWLENNPHVKFAQSADDTGVLISWNVEGKNNIDQYSMVVPDNAVCINPLNWLRDETPASIEENKGSLVVNENGQYQLVEGFANARINLDRGSVICDNVDPEIYGIPLEAKDLFGTESYHAWDFGFYYMNIRENAQLRLDKFYS